MIILSVTKGIIKGTLSNIFDVTKGFSNGNIKLHISTNGRFIITK